MILALALCILIISSAPSPYLNLSWNTLIIPIPQEPAVCLAFASPRARKIFLSRTESPSSRQAEISTSLLTEVSQLLAQCMVHSMLSTVFLLEETEVSRLNPRLTDGHAASHQTP